MYVELVDEHHQVVECELALTARTRAPVALAPALVLEWKEADDLKVSARVGGQRLGLACAGNRASHDQYPLAWCRRLGQRTRREPREDEERRRRRPEQCHAGTAQVQLVV